MKIRIQHVNGIMETLTLVPPISAQLGDKLNHLTDSSGMEYWFDQDGYYDGWGMPLPDVSETEAYEAIDRVEKSREIERFGSSEPDPI